MAARAEVPTLARTEVLFDNSNCCGDCPDFNTFPPVESDCPNFEMRGEKAICNRPIPVLDRLLIGGSGTTLPGVACESLIQIDME